MKLEDTIALITESILANGGTQELVNKTVADIRKAAEEEKEERKSVAKKNKHQFQIVVSDPKGSIPAGTELVGWVLQIEESAAPTAAIQRIKDAAFAYNNSKRGRRTPTSTIGEAMSVPRKYWKRDNASEKTLVKTHEPVFVQITDNRLN